MIEKYPGYSLAVENIKEKRYDQAFQILGKTIEETRRIDESYIVAERAEMYRLRGLCKLSLNDPDSAVEELETAFMYSIRNQKIGHDLGVALLKIGRTEEALAHFKEVTESKPAPESLIYRGLTHKALGDEKSGEKDFEEARSDFDKFMKRFAVGATTILAGAAILIYELAIQQRIAVMQTDENSHRTDENEIRGAIRSQVIEPIFAWLDIDEQTIKELSQKTPGEIAAICKDLNQADNGKEVAKILTKKYSEKLSTTELEFFDIIYSQAAEFKKTKRYDGNFEKNHVYSAAIIESDNQRLINRFINSEKLQKYLGIFYELLTERTISTTRLTAPEATMVTAPEATKLNEARTTTLTNQNTPG
jgi:tetratricopeptide (TPR) repeat protein